MTGGPNGLGTPIGIFGKGFGATQGSSKVTIGGVEVARYLTWGRQNAVNGLLDMVVVQPGPDLVSGAIEVTVGGIKSTGLAGFQRTDGRIYSIAIGLGLGGVLGSGPVSNAVERPRREGARGRRGLAPRR